MRRAASAGTSSDVQVAIRVRPLNDLEKSTPGCTDSVETGDTFVVLRQNELETTYAFDSVFGPESSTVDMYEKVAEPIISSCFQGVNGTIFAYGQTASGKTFTMQGKESNPGILRLAARRLFEANDKWSVSASVSYIEIYNERIKDLLSVAAGKQAQEAASDLKVREDPQKGFFVDGVVEASVANYEQLLERFQEGERRRHVAGTDMNEKSSRSHTVFALNLSIKPSASNKDPEFMGGTLRSRLSLVDLAGSENVRNTNAEGERLKEGGQINKSLLTLSMVISSLAKGKDGAGQHVKFRDSKLTQILQPSLVGNCRTAVVCCITPASIFAGETLSTLKFANSAKNIKTEFVVNQMVDQSRSIKSYQEQIEAFQAALRIERLEQETLRASKFVMEQELDRIRLAHAEGVAQLQRESSNLLSSKEAFWEEEERRLLCQVSSQRAALGDQAKLLASKELMIQEHESAIQALNLSIDQYKHEHAATIQASKNVALALETQHRVSASLRADLEALENVKAEADANLESERCVMAILRDELDKEKRCVLALEGQLIAKFEEHKENARVAEANHQRQLTELEGRCEMAEGRLQAKNEVEEALQVRLSSSEVANRGLMEKLERLENEKRTIVSQFEESKLAYQSLSTALGTSKNDVMVLSKRSEELEKLVEEVEGSRETAKQECVTLRAELEQSKVAEALLEAEKLANEALIHQLEKGISDQQFRLDAQQHDIGTQGEKIAQLQVLRNRTSDELSEANIKIKALEKEVENSSSEVVSLGNSLSDAKEALQRAESEIGTLGDANRRMHDELVQSVSTISSLTAACSELTEAKSALEFRLGEAEIALAEMAKDKEEMMSRWSCTDKSLQSTLLHLEQLTTEKGVSNDTLARMMAAEARFKQDLAEAMQMRAATAEELSETRSELKNSRQALASLESASRDLAESLRKEIDVLLAEKTQASQECEKLCETVHAERTKMESIEVELAEEKERFKAELFSRQAMEVRVDSLNRSIREELDALLEVKAHLEDALQFEREQFFAAMDRVDCLSDQLGEEISFRVDLQLSLAAVRAELNVSSDVNEEFLLQKALLHTNMAHLQSDCDWMEMLVTLQNADEVERSAVGSYDLVQSSAMVRRMQRDLEDTQYQEIRLRERLDATELAARILLETNAMVVTREMELEEQLQIARQAALDAGSLAVGFEERTEGLSAELAIASKRLVELEEEKAVVENKMVMVSQDQSGLSQEVMKLGHHIDCLERELEVSNCKSQEAIARCTMQSAEIARLKDEVASLECSRADIDEERTLLQHRVSTLLGNVESLQSSMMKMEDEIIHADMNRIRREEEAHTEVANLELSIVTMEGKAEQLYQRAAGSDMECEFLAEQMRLLGLQLRLVELDREMRLMDAQACIMDSEMNYMEFENSQEEILEKLASVNNSLEDTTVQKSTLECAMVAVHVQLVRLSMENDRLSDIEIALRCQVDEGRTLCSSFEGDIHSRDEIIRAQEQKAATIERTLLVKSQELVRVEDILKTTVGELELLQTAVTSDDNAKDALIQSLRAQESSSKAALESLNAENTGLAIEVEGLEGELQNVNAVVTRAESNSLYLEAKLVAMQEQVSLAGEQIIATSVERDALEDHVSRLSIVVKDLEEQLSRDHLMMEDAKGSSNKVTDELKRVSEECYLLKQAGGELEQCLRAKAQEAHETSLKLFDKETEVALLTRMQDSLTATVNQLERDLDEQMATCAQLQATIARVQEDKLALAHQGEEPRASTEETSRTRTMAMEAKVQFLESQISALDMEKARCDEEHRRISCQIMAEKSTVESLAREQDSDLRDLRFQLEAAMGELKTAKQITASMNATSADELARARLEVASVRAEAEAEVEQLRKVVTELDQEHQRLITTHEKDLSVLKSELVTCQERTRDIAASTQSERDQALAKVHLALINTEARLAASISDNAQRRDEVAKCRAECGRLEASVAKLTKQTQQLSTNLADSVLEIEQYKASMTRSGGSSLTQAQAEMEKLKTTVAQLETEMQALRKRNEKLEENKLTQRIKDEIDDLKHECSSLKAENTRLKPLSSESLGEFEKKMMDALKARDDAIDKLKRFTEAASDKQAALEEQRKLQVRELEKENLGLFKRLKELGALERKKENGPLLSNRN